MFLGVGSWGISILHELKTVGRTGLVMILRSAGEEGRCPACARSSRRVHSRYSRQLSDLPWEGIPVRIELRVRRFVCGAGQCDRRIFTERFPNTVKRYSRRTCRLSTALEQITLALGGSAWLSPGGAARNPGQRFHAAAKLAEESQS